MVQYIFGSVSGLTCSRD